MLRFIKKMFMGLLELLSSIVNASSNGKCASFNNQQCTTQLNLINLHLHEYSKGLYYYPFAVDLDRCFGSCSTFDDLSNKVCVPKKKKQKIKCECCQHDYRNKQIKNINKKYIMQV